MAGQVDLLIDSVGVLFPVYKAGLVKVLAITAAKRVSELPGIPTLAEFGLGSDDLSSWYDVFARKEFRRRSSPNSTAPLTRAWRFRRCELASRRWSCNPTGGSQRAFVDFLARDRQRWEKIIKRANEQQ